MSAAAGWDASFLRRVVLSAARWWVLAWAVAASMASAAPGVVSIHDFRHNRWTETEGAPAAIAAMAQTTDDVLWLGTSEGLYRFDALHFEHVDLPGHPELDSAGIFSLCATPDGGLWIGYVLGGAVYQRGDRATSYDEHDGLPAGSVRTLHYESNGTVWASTTHGLARFVAGRWQSVPLPASMVDVRIKFIDSDDTLWLTGRQGGFTKIKWRDDFVPIKQPLDPDFSLAESSTGDIWAYKDKVIRLVGHATHRPSNRPSPTDGFLIDDTDSAWLVDRAADSSLSRVSASTLPRPLSSIRPADRFTSSDGYPQAGLYSLLEDSDGNIWAGGPSGLERFSKAALVSLRTLPSHPLSLGNQASTIVPADLGKLWIAQPFDPGESSRQDGFVQYKDRAFVTYKTDHETLDASSGIRTEGAAWFGGSRALWKEVGDGLTRFALPKSFDGAAFQSLAGDGHSGVWASIVRKGIYHFSAGTWTFQPQVPVALVVARDSAGRLWLGYPDGRIACLAGTQVQWFAKPDGLDLGAVTSIEIQGGHVWVGGNGGLARWDGHRFTTIRFEADTRPRNVMGIVLHDDGDLWLLSATGLMRIPASEVAAATSNTLHAVSAELFDARDGLEGGLTIRPSPALVEGTDGMLWATTMSGIYGLDPAHLVRANSAPRVMLRALTADGRRYPLDGVQTLPARTSSLRIDYQGLNLSAAEKIRYRVRLEGFDKGWQDVQDRREAFFTNLPPGDYRFRVQAHLVAQPWNNQEASLAFTIQAAFVQTRTFLGLCALALAGLVWIVVAVRVLHVRRRLNLLFEARMSERERIARDLHDTIVQSAQALILKVHAVARRLRPDDPQRAQLDAVLADADLTLAEGRDRISDLRRSGRTTAGLREDLINVGASIAREGSVRFEHATDNAVRELDPDVADEVFSIGREALLNAGRHAQAGRIALELADTRDGFAMSVIDDGLGMDDATLARARATGHWGLAGMRERAERIGAALELSSRPDQGTEVVLRIPADVAYRSSLLG